MRRRSRCPGVLLLATLATGACGPIATTGPGCRSVSGPTALPDGLGEASGVAVSVRHPGVLWTHNDAGSVLFAVDARGAEIARFRLPIRLYDWEDLAVAPCVAHGSCLYAADLGDNYEERHDLRVVRMAEPDPTTTPEGILESEVFPVSLPQGPRDVEALLVLPEERVLVVTKGRNHPVTVYRYPSPLRSDTVTLEEVQRLSDGPRIFPRQVTGGAVSPEGEVAALRTYESLRFYRIVGDTLATMEDGLVNLRTLRETQGEGVGLGPAGSVVLTSEAGPGGGSGSVAVLRCSAERW